MLRPRIIPCLLVRDMGLVKTVGFSAPTYVGDPINATKIFNEKQVDELMVLDIDATAQGRGPNYRLIEDLAAESRMPLCYGGGVKNAEQVKRIIALGVEKIAISSAAIQNPSLVADMAEAVGSQSVVAVLDVKPRSWGSKYDVWTQNATVNTRRHPAELAVEMEQAGVGEIVVNSIVDDGRMKGYDLKLVEMVREATSVPLTVLGGAGSLADIGKLIRTFGVIGAAAGSLFLFKGNYRAVLINYPSLAERDELIRENFVSPTERFPADADECLCDASSAAASVSTGSY
jgi:imidazole glycerol-phosphate synthase subunit HisF